MNPEEFIARTTVSLDEMKLWHERGWLSFDPCTIDEYDEREWMEVRFIRAMARFGLSCAMIDNLLFGLKRPFCYDPEETFYSFADESWITLPKKPDRTETTLIGIQAFARNEAWDELEKELLRKRAY